MTHKSTTSSLRRMDSIIAPKRRQSSATLRRMDTMPVQSISVEESNDTRRSGKAREQILEQRRLRNIESAKRSRARLSNEQNWIAVQMSENDERMSHLEKKVHELTVELTKPKKSAVKREHHHPSKQQRKDGHQAWFGEPF